MNPKELAARLRDITTAYLHDGTDEAILYDAADLLDGARREFRRAGGPLGDHDRAAERYVIETPWQAVEGESDG